MSVPSFKTAEERKISRIDRFKPAILPLALFTGGLLNGARGDSALLTVAN